MKRKNKRLSLISAGMLALAGAVALILMAFEDNIVFFYSPTEIVQKQLRPEQRLRLGGLELEIGNVLRGSAGKESPVEGPLTLHRHSTARRVVCQRAS